jgi:hypothetical protein
MVSHRHTTADSSSSGTPFEAVVNATYPGLTSDNLETLKAMYTEVGITEENMAEFGLGEAMFRCGVGVFWCCNQADAYLDVDAFSSELVRTSGPHIPMGRTRSYRSQLSRACIR